MAGGSARRDYATPSLVAVAVAYGVAQVYAAGLHRFVSSDEAVYLVKAVPSLAIARWEPSRALGLPWLIAPIAVVTHGSIFAMRLWLLICASVGLFAAFRAWLPVLGPSVVVASALFAGSWLALFFGSEAYPNLSFALAVVSGAGWCVSGMLDIDAPRRWRLWSGLAFAVAATIRPTDALLIFGGLAIAAVIVSRARAIPALIAAAVGVVVGWTIWTVESYVSFGSPLARWRDAFGHVAGQPLSKFVDTTALVAIGAPFSSARVLTVFGSWLLLASAVICGVVVAVRRREWSGPVAAMVAALPLLVAYLVFPSDSEARFLLPVYALLALPAGYAAMALLESARRVLMARAALVPLVAVVAVLFGWNVRTAAIASRGQHHSGLVTTAAGREIARLAAGRPCIVGSQFNPPGVALASGCRAERVAFDASDRLPPWWRGRNVYFTGRYPPVEASPLNRWRAIRLRAAQDSHITVYERPG